MHVKSNLNTIYFTLRIFVTLGRYFLFLMRLMVYFYL